MDKLKIILAILEERERQDNLHPVFDKPLSTLIEEVGEIGTAIQNGDTENLKVELIQTAAVCMRWLESIHDVPYGTKSFDITAQMLCKRCGRNITTGHLFIRWNGIPYHAECYKASTQYLGAQL